MRVGVIARDEQGFVVASKCTIVTFITDPTIVEVVAIWKTAEFCRDLQSTWVIMEGDALKIVQALRQ